MADRRVWPGRQVTSATPLPTFSRTSSTPAEYRRQLLDEPDAGGAVDALEVEPRPAAIGADVLRPLRLDALVVEVGERPSRDARGLERAPLLADQPVVLIEAPLVDERVDLPAAGAAELLRLAFADEARRHREPAVRARAGGPARNGARPWLDPRAGTLAEPAHRPLPAEAAASACTVSRAAWTKRSACCLVSIRSSHAPGSSTSTSVR